MCSVQGIWDLQMCNLVVHILTTRLERSISVHMFIKWFDVKEY